MMAAFSSSSKRYMFVKSMSMTMVLGMGCESDPVACIAIYSVSNLTVNLGCSIFCLYLHPVTKLSLQFISLK